MAQLPLCHANTMKRRIFSFVLCIMMLLSMVPLVGAPEVHAATDSQNNIVARADYMYGLTWTCQQTVYGWNYNYTFSAGSTYRAPYGQPINSGYYIGYGVAIDTYMSAANTYGSVFYTSRSTYGSTSSVYYATDCSAFVSWCWGTSRYTTYSIPQVSTYIGMATAANAYSLQLGDALNSNDVGHVVLVTGLTYSGSTLTQIEITEQTPPQLKRSYYTPSELGSKYGTYYSIQRYSGTVPASPGGNTNDDSGSSSSGSTSSGQYYPACGSSYTSFYPAMESLGYSVDWELHCEIAEANGITDFTGTAEQNTTLLNLLKAGKLIIPGSSSSSSSGSSDSSSSGTVTDGKTGYDRGYSGGVAGTGSIIAHGLDVSSWQGSDLSFTRIKNAGYDFVILRAGTTNGKDTCFETYYTNAKAAGLDVGAYYYSYATTVSAAKADAEDFLSYIDGKTYEYPLYFDYEDSTQQALSSSLSTQICLTFMDMIAAEGYLTGMYTGKYFSTQLDIDTICDKYELWIAHYLRSSGDGTNDWTTYGYTYASQYGMYQYTSGVYISGYGPYDGDVVYKDYPTIVKTYGFNGYGSSISGGSSSDSSSSDTTQSYIEKNCTFYPSRVQIEVTTATYLSTEPRSATDSNTAEKIEDVAVGTVYKTTGMYQNGGGNMWYQVETSTGDVGYIYSGRVSFVKKLYDDITLTSYDVPEAHVAGNIFYVTGTLSSTYNVITEARVYIYSGFGTSGTAVTGGSASITNNSYTLDNSTVDDATSFGDLSTGKYTYVISAPFYSYYASDTKTATKVSGTRTLKKHYFTVISSSVSQSSCSHSSQTTTVIEAATCTATGTSVTSCPTCGLTEKVTTDASHSYGSYVVVQAATCTTAGSKQKTCTVCGKVYTKTIAATAHTYSTASCTEAATCTVCGASSGSALGHDYAAATCTAPKTCTRCGATTGSKLGHSYTAATCTTAKTCSRCGTTSGSALGHTWNSATCTEAKTCATCGATSGSANGHNWVDATCTSPQTCSTCGTTSGSKLGHSYTAATCTEPKTCTRCGKTSGSALGHDWTDATCTTAKTCNTCGTTSGSALGHSYSSADCTAPATCTTCGVSTGSALGHEYSEATCESPSTCIRCGVVSDTIVPNTPTSILLGGTDAYMSSDSANIYLNHELRGYGLWIIKQATKASYGNSGIASDELLSTTIDGVSAETYLGGILRYHNARFTKGIGPVFSDDGTISEAKNGAYWTATAEADSTGLQLRYLQLQGEYMFGTSNVNINVEAFDDNTFLIYYIDGSNYRVLSMNSDGTWGYQVLTASQVKANLSNLKIRLYKYASDTGNRTLNIVGMQEYTAPVGADANSIVNYIAGKLAVTDIGRNGLEVSCSGTTGKIGYYWLDGNFTTSTAGDKTITIKYRNDDATDTVIGTVTLHVAANATLSASNYTSGTKAVETATKNYVFTQVADSDGPRYNDRYLIVHNATNQIMSYDPLAQDPSTGLGHDFADATCTAPMTCTRCGITSGSALGHTWNSATCTAAKTCIICGATSGSADGHDWVAATCTAPKTCATCGATTGSTLEHNYADATCTAPKTCTTCGATSGSKLGHSYAAATCTTPKTCTRCGGTTSSALGHDWKDATCTTAKTCATCGISSGPANGHSWVAATCTAPKTCISCGVTSGSALGHSYVDDVCARCDAKSPYITVYFENNWWWSDVSIYYWGSSTIADATWPGIAMTYVETDGYGYDIYRAQVPADATGIIFNGIKDDGSSTLDQSPDITDISTGVCYYMTWDNGNSYSTFTYPFNCTITQKGRTLSYEDLIYVIDIFELTGIEGVDLTTDAGLLIWSVEEFEALSEIAFDAAHANAGLIPYKDTGFYSGSSDGIFTNNLHEEAYYVGYVKLPNGSYTYSEAKLYSPAIYATTMLEKTNTSESTKNLCVALLNYISAAQVYFHNAAEADLANYSLTDEQKTLVWDDSLTLSLAPEVPSGMQVTADSTVFTSTGKNLLFEEMISLTAIYKIDDSIIADAKACGTIFWTAEQFAEISGTPSITNYGDGTKADLAQYRNTSGQWCSHAPAIAAKEMADTQYYFMAYVVHSDGTVSYSSVSAYTIETYISKKANLSTPMGQFAIALYHYERAAETALNGE